MVNNHQSINNKIIIKLSNHHKQSVPNNPKILHNKMITKSIGNIINQQKMFINQVDTHIQTENKYHKTTHRIINKDQSMKNQIKIPKYEINQDKKHHKNHFSNLHPKIIVIVAMLINTMKKIMLLMRIIKKRKIIHMINQDFLRKIKIQIKVKNKINWKMSKTNIECYLDLKLKLLLQCKNEFFFNI